MCQSTQATNCNSKFLYYLDDSKSQGKKYLTLPKRAIRGIESIIENTEGSRPTTGAGNIWSSGFYDGTQRKGGEKGTSGFKSLQTAIMVINAVNYRSKHQMHLHTGDIKTSSPNNLFYTQCLAKIRAQAGQTNILTTPDITCTVDGSSGSGFANSDAVFRAVEVANLGYTNTWGNLVLAVGDPRGLPGGKDKYRVGMFVIASKTAGKYMVVIFAGKNKDNIGDYSFVDQ